MYQMKIGFADLEVIAILLHNHSCSHAECPTKCSNEDTD